MWLSNCQLVDLERAGARPAAVEVVDGRVATVADVVPPSASDVWDLKGRFLLPGLISCHTHLSVVYPFDANDEGENAASTVLRSLSRAEDALHAGVTAIRCVHEQNRADLLLRTAARQGWVRIPRIFAAGRALSTTGGHGWGSGAVYVDGAAEFLAAARAELAAGADHIKVFITGGLAHAGEVMTGMQLTEEELAGAVRAASEHTRYVVAHAANSAAIAAALRVGVRSFEHAYELDDATARELARSGAFLTPTLCVSRLPNWMADHHFTSDQIERAMAAGPAHLDSIKRAVDAGVTLVGGTDYPPGEPVDGTVVAVRELEFLVDAGLSPLEAVRAGTVNAADLVQQSHQLGQIRPGFVGDLIASADDPSVDVSALRSVSFVMSNGVVVRDDTRADGYRA